MGHKKHRKPDHSVSAAPQPASGGKEPLILIPEPEIGVRREETDVHKLPSKQAQTSQERVESRNPLRVILEFPSVRYNLAYALLSLICGAWFSASVIPQNFHFTLADLFDEKVRHFAGSAPNPLILWLVVGAMLVETWALHLLITGLRSESSLPDAKKKSYGKRLSWLALLQTGVLFITIFILQSYAGKVWEDFLVLMLVFVVLRQISLIIHLLNAGNPVKKAPSAPSLEAANFTLLFPMFVYTALLWEGLSDGLFFTGNVYNLLDWTELKAFFWMALGLILFVLLPIRLGWLIGEIRGGKSKLEQFAFWLTLCVYFGAALSPLVKPFGAADYIERAENLAGSEQFKNQFQAMKDFDRALKMEPGNLRAAAGKGMLQYRQKHYSAAATALENLAAKGYLAEGASYTLGECYYHLTNWEKAAFYYSASVRRNVSNIEGWYGLAWSRFKMGNTSQALSDINRAIALSSNESRFYDDRAVYLLQLGKTNEAYPDIRRAAAMGSTWSSNWLAENAEDVMLVSGEDSEAAGKALGGRFYKMSNWTRSDYYYSMAIRHNPTNARYHYDRAWALFGAGLYHAAIVDLDQAIRLRPEYAVYPSDRGYFLLQAGETNAALADIRKAAAMGDDWAKKQAKKYQSWDKDPRKLGRTFQ